MKKIMLFFFKFFFKIKPFKKYYFGLYTRIFKPYNLFEGLVIKTKFNNNFLLLHLEDWLQQNIFFLGEYEKAELKTLDSFLKNDSVFIDIGANIGIYSLYASNTIKDEGKIIAFEPFPTNYNTLSKNVAINHKNNIVLENQSIGSQVGCLTLYYDEKDKNLGMVSSYENENSTATKVPVTTLDIYSQNNQLEKIDFIKIDIEGHEYEALKGMRNTLIKFKPTILIEVLVESKEQNKQNKVHNFLTDLNYTKHFIDDNGKISLNNENVSRRNYIYS